MPPLLGPRRAAADVAGGDTLVDSPKKKWGIFGEIPTAFIPALARSSDGEPTPPDTCHEAQNRALGPLERRAGKEVARASCRGLGAVTGVGAASGHSSQLPPPSHQ